MAAMLIRGHGATMVSSTSLYLGQFTRKVSSRQMQKILPCFSLSSSSKPTTSQHAIPLIATHRHASSTSYMLRKSDEGQASTAELHSLYHDQMNEIQSEREELFGTTASDDASDSPDLSQTAKSYFESKDSVEQPSELSSKPAPPNPPTGWDAEQAEEAYFERESLFAFSEEEKSAWSNNDGDSGSNIHRICALMREHDKKTDTGNTPQSSSTPPSASPFSHLTPQGDGVSMVDVGHKTISRRVAVARSVVIFPPEVLSAFQMNKSNSEMIGPKGPIFETAKIAGIMGAKKTSDLIPLCHPLPLDRVNINIQLIHNQAIIECECRVTHKTGVEMEALTGATIAALTIYDMVKAVSHRVEIGQTVLVSKSGGKSGDFVHN